MITVHGRDLVVVAQATQTDKMTGQENKEKDYQKYMYNFLMHDGRVLRY